MASCEMSCSSSCNGGNTEYLLRKIDSMISDNFTLLGLMLVMFVILILSLVYFGKSLYNTVQAYYKSKTDVDNASKQLSVTLDNPGDPLADNEIYYDDVKEDPTYNARNDFLPKGTKTFVEDLNNIYREYNDEKTKFIALNFNGRQNDDPITQSTLYSRNDDFLYTSP